MLRCLPWLALVCTASGLALAAPNPAAPNPNPSRPAVPRPSGESPAAPRPAGAKAVSQKASAASAAKGEAKPAKLDLERWRKALESNNEPELLGALEEMTGQGENAAAAAPMVNALLTRGTNTKVLLAALNTAATLGQPSSSDAVAPYASHRHAEIRRAAARALARTKGPRAVAALRQALAGNDPVNRGIAAAGLGQLGATEAVDELFAVLVRDTPEAAVSIASLCNPEQCDRLVDFVGRLKFEVLEASFVPLLLRPSTVLPDANKIRYIERLRRLQTKGASAVLETVQASLPKHESPAVHAALTAALRARPVVGDPSP